MTVHGRAMTTCALLLTGVSLATACSSPSTSRPYEATIKRQVVERLARLRSDLPSGFTAPGRNAALGAPRALVVAPAPANLVPNQFTSAPVPDTATLKRVLAAAVNEPFPLVVRNLLTNGEPHAGGTVTVVATHLSPKPGHDALFVLQGPHQYRAERLVQVSNDIAAGVVHLPSRMAAGPWYLIVEDSSEVTNVSPTNDSGQILVDIGQLHAGR